MYQVVVKQTNKHTTHQKLERGVFFVTHVIVPKIRGGITRNGNMSHTKDFATAYLHGKNNSTREALAGEVYHLH
jgi:hypothetical protein